MGFLVMRPYVVFAENPVPAIVATVIPACGTVGVTVTAAAMLESHHVVPDLRSRRVCGLRSDDEVGGRARNDVELASVGSSIDVGRPDNHRLRSSAVRSTKGDGGQRVRRAHSSGGEED